MKTLLEQTFTKAQLPDIALEVLQLGKEYPVWALSGQLGAGKTTFTHALCDILGVTDAVSSPTFSIINQYDYTDEGGTARTMYHSDWYRLNDEEEAINAGVEDMISHADGLCIIEWWEKAPDLLPARTFYISLEVLDEQTRTIKCSIK